MHDDRLDAQYLSLGDTTPAQTFRQPDVIAQRDMLVDAIRGDMQRIASGAQLPALGQAQACTYCDARGLCRKDYWELGEQAVPSDG